MSKFEVFVPVQGEYIVTVEADSAADAIALISEGEVDWSEGEPNLEDDWERDIRASLIADDDATTHGYRAWDDATLEPLPVTFNAETGQPYAMRHCDAHGEV